MGLPLTLLAPRGFAIAVSAALHVGLAASLAHSTTRAHPLEASGADVLTVDTVVEVTAPELVPIPTPLPTPLPAPAQAAQASASHETHHHAYPVPHDHDATPHDPSLVHEPTHEPARDLVQDKAHDLADAPAPRFTMVIAPASVVLPPLTTAATSSASPSSVAQARGEGNAGALGARTGSDGRVGADRSGSEGSSDTTTFAENGVSTPAKLLARSTATYPAAARSNGDEADVLLEIVLDTQGHVVDAHVVTAAGGGFDESALAAIRSYRFSPAQRAGHAVRVRMRWPVQFRLR